MDPIPINEKLIWDYERRVKSMEILPRMIRPLDMATLQAFFLGLASDLMTSVADP